MKKLQRDIDNLNGNLKNTEVVKNQDNSIILQDENNQ
jgi:hypothetical protein